MISPTTAKKRYINPPTYLFEVVSILIEFDRIEFFVEVNGNSAIDLAAISWPRGLQKQSKKA